MKWTDGLSGSALRCLCREAAMLPVREYVARQEQPEHEQLPSPPEQVGTTAEAVVGHSADEAGPSANVRAPAGVRRGCAGLTQPARSARSQSFGGERPRSSKKRRIQLRPLGLHDFQVAMRME